MKIFLLENAGYDRPGKITSAIEKWNSGIEAEMRLLKYEKMVTTPYSFYRGSNHLFWSDFEGGWTISQFGSPGTRTWIQGDAHVYNMGAFLNHDKEVVFGFNDFDDSVVADYQYDVWRMAISIVLVAREFKLLDQEGQDRAVSAFSENYLQTVTHFSHEDYTHEVHFTKENTTGRLQKFLEKVSLKQSRKKMLDKWTVIDEHGNRIFNLAYEKLAPVSDDIREKIIAAMPDYRRTIIGDIPAENDEYFRVKDIAKRLLAGTGSLGKPRYYVLIEGGIFSDDDIILDVKLQDLPTPYRYFDKDEQQEYDANYEHHAQRHAEACLALSEDPDNYLGWMSFDGGHYSVRERSPFKKEFPCEELDTEKRFVTMAEQWGRILAEEHKRSARRLYKDLPRFFFENNIHAKTRHAHEGFQRLVRDVAFSYANQVHDDWYYFVGYVSQKYKII